MNNHIENKKMKNTLLLAALLISASASAQCPTPNCNQTWSVPIADINAHNNQQGNKCYSGNGTLGSNTNINNATFLSYNGDITANHPINGINIFTSGTSAYLSYVTLDGGDTIYVDCPTNIPYIISNNSISGNRNVIALTNNGTITANGAQYFAGQTIVTQGNQTNEIDVIQCQGTPLGTKIIRWELKGGKIYYELTTDVEWAEIQHAPLASPTNFTTETHTKLYYNYFTAKEGYWRLKAGHTYSEIIHAVNSPYINTNNIRKFNVLGQEFTPIKGQLYFQNGAKYIQE